MKTTNPAKVATTQLLMMSMLSSLTLQTALKLWKQDSPLLRSLLQQLAHQAKKEVEQLNLGINKYHSFTLAKQAFSGKVINQIRTARLIHYSAQGEPVLVVPSLINKPHILDLNSNNSFMHTLQSHGLNAHLLDWGSPTVAEKNFSLQCYINEILVPVVDYLYNLHGKINIIGYCMGGFIAAAMACLRPEYLSKLITVASPWDFKYWNKLPNSFIEIIKGNSELISASVIQQLFYLHNPFEINRKFINYAAGNFDAEEFAQIENWVNDGIDMTQPVFIECFEEMLGQNKLMENRWYINDQLINPALIDIPIMSVVFKKDRIVPLPSALSFAEQCQKVNLLQIDSGHIGAIINRKYKLAEQISKWMENE